MEPSLTPDEMRVNKKACNEKMKKNHARNVPIVQPSSSPLLCYNQNKFEISKSESTERNVATYQTM